jgi:GGDEF domain-containing protein
MQSLQALHCMAHNLVGSGKIHGYPTISEEVRFIKITKKNKTNEYCCTASISVVVFISDDRSQDNVLEWADRTMYAAKESGGNQICFNDTTI